MPSSTTGIIVMPHHRAPVRHQHWWPDMAQRPIRV